MITQKVLQWLTVKIPAAGNVWISSQNRAKNKVIRSHGVQPCIKTCSSWWVGVCEECKLLMLLCLLSLLYQKKNICGLLHGRCAWWMGDVTLILILNSDGSTHLLLIFTCVYSNDTQRLVAVMSSLVWFDYRINWQWTGVYSQWCKFSGNCLNSGNRGRLTKFQAIWLFVTKSLLNLRTDDYDFTSPCFK